MMTDLIGVTLASESGSLPQRLLESLSEPWQLWLFFFGLLGQVIFFLRWVFQWISSERRGTSHMPEIFWWCSLIGALILLTYFILRLDPIGVIGQMTGWIIYARNLYLLKKHRRAGEPVRMPSPETPETTEADEICPSCGQPLVAIA